MKILIVGSTGMLGSTFKEYVKTLNVQYQTLDRVDLDLSNCNFEDLKNKIVDSNCTVLVNCVGLIKQRKGLKTSDFIRINSLLPHIMSDICFENNIKMIHITTDCVFSGSVGNYDENFTHDSTDDYGRSKSIGEPYNCMVIRTSIIGEESKNKLSLLEWVKSNKNMEIKGFKNHLWNGVTCLQLSKLIFNFIKNNINWSGVRHIFSNQVSKYELVKYINEIYELNIKIHPIDDKFDVNRTLSSIYNITEYNIPSIDKQIEETLLFHKKYEKI
jgi:dTDP-4-dehydrorhamnose reductase